MGEDQLHPLGLKSRKSLSWYVFLRVMRETGQRGVDSVTEMEMTTFVTLGAFEGIEAVRGLKEVGGDSEEQQM